MPTKKKKSPARYQDLLNQLNAVHKICCVIYSNPAIQPYAKESLKIAEWELYDFTIWDNEFGNNSESVTRWFDQWCYSINYDLI